MVPKEVAHQSGTIDPSESFRSDSKWQKVGLRYQVNATRLFLPHNLYNVNNSLTLVGPQLIILGARAYYTHFLLHGWPDDDAVRFSAS